MNKDVIYLGKKEIIPGEGKEKKNRETAAGRQLLQELLCRFYGADLREEENPIGIAPGGKPYLIHHPQIHFNLSHSGNYVVCACAGFPLGIDLQENKTLRTGRLPEKIMNETEWERYQKTGQPLQFFYQCWTRKESYLKYTGEGITRSLRELTGRDCQFLEVPAFTGYTLTLCIPEGRQPQIFFA